MTTDTALLISHQRLLDLLNYDPETGVLSWGITRGGWVKKGVPCRGISAKGYVYIRLDDRLYMGHRLAWFYTHKTWPADQIDHINGIKTDNRISNLRAATNRQNQQNTFLSTRENKSSGLLGVTLHKPTNRWRAAISHCNRRIHIGLFDQKKDAHQAYLETKRKLHEFCTI